MVIFEKVATDKVIFNMFICKYKSPTWEENVNILKDIKFPTSIETSKGHHNGLAIQVLLDIDLESAKKFSEEISSKFKNVPLIVIAEVNVVMKKTPIGYYFDKDLFNFQFLDRTVSKIFSCSFPIKSSKSISSPSLKT